MPSITISEDLYRQIESETGEKDIEEALWEMVGDYRRANNPEAEM